MSRHRITTARGLALSAAPTLPTNRHELAGVALERVAQQNTLVVDREARTIDGVTIITSGECHPCNGPRFLCDDASLASIVRAINDAPLPVRVHVTHPQLSAVQGDARAAGIDGILRLVGVIGAARTENGRTRGRVTFGRYADASPLGRMAEYLLGIAEEHPTNVGLSIHIGQGWLERSPGEELGRLRVTSLRSVDFVGEPGGNPAGMLAGAPGVFPAARIATSGDTPDSPPALEGPTMTVTAAQLEYLESLGLKTGATPAEIDAFIATLDAEKKTHLLGLGAVATVAAPANGSAAATSTPGAALARGHAAATSAVAGAMLAAAASPAPAAAASADGLTLARAIRQVAHLSGLGDQWAMDRIEEGCTVERATTLALASRAPQTPLPIGGNGNGNGRVHVGDDQNLSTLRDGIVDGILLRANVKLENPHPRANEFRGRRIVDMARVVLSAIGVRDAQQWPAARVALACMHRQRWMQALEGVGLAAGAYSAYISSFSNVLANVANKSMQRRYAQLQPSWPKFCSPGIAPDFKNQDRPAISTVPALVLTPPGDLITFATRSDRKETWALGTYTGGWVYPFQQLINDDLRAFDKDPQDAALKSRQKEDSLAFAVLSGNPTMSDSVALFHATHANLAASGAALSEATISAARAAMRKQTDLGSSEPLDLVPGVCIVPAEYESLATRLFASPTTHGNSAGDKNPIEGLCEVVASGRLATTAYFFAVRPGTGGETIEIGFLEGFEAPEVSTEEDFDSMTQKHSVAHHVTAKALDHRTMYKNPGA